MLDKSLVLSIDRAYFALTGGLERWLYRIVRKHGGRQKGGWSFDLDHLHLKSASLSPFKRFAFELRDIVRRQPLPGYALTIERNSRGRECLVFKPTESGAQTEMRLAPTTKSCSPKSVRRKPVDNSVDKL